jgi:hypothetical protein
VGYQAVPFSGKTLPIFNIFRKTLIRDGMPAFVAVNKKV